MMRPYLVNKIKSSGLVEREFFPEVIDESICKPSVIEAARKCMEAVITEGTAKAVFADVPFPVAGKTGTAHVAGGNVKYYDGVYQASFVGYFPADQPEYSCIVVVKTKPHAAIHYGGQLAAPVFKEVATKLYAMYVQKKVAPVQLTPDSSLGAYAGYADDVKNILHTVGVNYKDSSRRADWNTVYSNPDKLVVKASDVKSNTIPDVRNMTLKDALYVLENRNVKVLVRGRGKVVAQDILPGTRINRNQKITLLLN
jgi:cell division protein FtsI (penicillin-binding protein 3)